RPAACRHLPARRPAARRRAHRGDHAGGRPAHPRAGPHHGHRAHRDRHLRRRRLLHRPALPEVPTVIEISIVAKRKCEHRVADRGSLTIPRGGVTSIIGANGAGKSTLLSIISRLLPADEGTVTVDGMDVATTPTERLARRLAILRQDNHMPVRLTVRELVAFG